MADEELKTAHVINCAPEGRLTVYEAAKALGFTDKSLSPCLVPVWFYGDFTSITTS